MTKIFYAVQATGNGHLSRATQLYPYLKKYGEVDFFVSGSNSTLDYPFPVKYRSKGWSLHYSKCGGLNYWDVFKSTQPINLYKDAAQLPLKEYDFVINDFDFITSIACKIQKVNSVQLGHQASFISANTPRPEKKSKVGEIILKHYAKATNNIGLHFQKYDDFIFPPVIKNEIIQSNVTNLNHVTVYLPAFQQECLYENFKKLKEIQFHWFLPEIIQPYTENNITFYPVNQELFNRSLVSCHGLITGGGFETPSEALYLGKRLMSIPIQDHYEQQCNAAALKKMGVVVLENIDENFARHIEKWYLSLPTKTSVKANDINSTIEFLFDTYPNQSATEYQDSFLFV
ncbi:MAG: hypothetical protein RIQ33_2409 [Bacteroidota bacterium]|jgi:uncharacterized protein (TIGR00661 family)